jgi:hypothetical protein
MAGTPSRRVPAIFVSDIPVYYEPIGNERYQVLTYGKAAFFLRFVTSSAKFADSAILPCLNFHQSVGYLPFSLLFFAISRDLFFLNYHNQHANAHWARLDGLPGDIVS